MIYATITTTSSVEPLIVTVPFSAPFLPLCESEPAVTFTVVFVATIEPPIASLLSESAAYASPTVVLLSLQLIVELSTVTTLGAGAFTRCINLSTIYLKNVESIYNSTFQSCYNLLSLYLSGSIVCPLQSQSAFNSTPISTYTTSTGGIRGKIYVPSSLYDSYKTATN